MCLAGKCSDAGLKLSNQNCSQHSCDAEDIEPVDKLPRQTEQKIMQCVI